MTEATYRERLDSGFKRYAEKMNRGMTPEFHENHPNFEERWAVKFALHATAKFTQELFAEGEQFGEDTESPEFYRFYFAVKRVNNAWAGMNSAVAPDFPTLKRQTFNLLEELVEPDAVEIDLSLEDDGAIVRHSTQTYEDILSFLKSHAADPR